MASRTWSWILFLIVISGRKGSSRTPAKVDGRKYRSQLQKVDGIHWEGELLPKKLAEAESG